MVLAMSRPLRRTDTSFLHFRKRIPADILRLAKGKTFTFVIPCDDPNEPEIVATVRLNAEMKFSLRTREPAIAKLRAGLATAQFERYCNGLRNGPRPLTHKEIIALSGIIYRERIENWEDNPGDPEGWSMAMDNEVDPMENPRELERQFGAKAACMNK